MSKKIIVPGLYRHYRGNLYLALNLTTDTKTGEERVEYIALYGGLKRYSQPTLRFLEIIDAPDYGPYHGPRMTSVEIPEKK